MDPLRWRRIEAVLDEAFKLTPGERAAFLAEACAGDDTLRAEVESLLAADGSQGGIPETWTTPTNTAAIPEQVGSYRLLQQIGEGGMGTVYLAEQMEPRRQVALKIVQSGMQTKQNLARFEAESQALALMDHPHVAKVFEAGTTPQSLPYFAMEYVEGVRITEHCDRHRLSNPERLQLFMQVCEGVQHAHQKGIIHRDLKPSNVLVALQGNKAVAKIIDFGVAKATAQRLTEKTLVTKLHTMIGTPDYMSPEQAEGSAQKVDTRTDVYSLGVMLYELLVGALPFDPRELRRGGLDEARRIIRQVDPPKPSGRLSTLGDEQSGESAKLRRVDASTLHRQLRGELDWIVMRALEKDRTRRYGSPAELAADIVRYLRNEPVLAGPPSAAYRARKFVRRHKLGVGVATTAVTVLVGFSLTMAVQAARIAAQRDRADEISGFLAKMLSDVDPESLGRGLVGELRERVAEVRRERGATRDQADATLAKFDQALSGVNSTDAALALLDEYILKRAGDTIVLELDQQPQIRSRLEQTLGETYRRFGLFDEAEQYTERALATQTRLLGRAHPETLESMNTLAVIYMDQGQYDEALKLHREALDIRRRKVGEQDPRTLESMNGLANVYFKLHRYPEAEELYTETLELRRRVLPHDDPETLASMNNLANVRRAEERYEEAERLYVDTIQAERQRLGPDHRSTLATMNNLAGMYLALGRFDSAEELYREILEGLRRALGERHPATLRAMNDLAGALAELGQQDEAGTLYRRSLDLQRDVLGPYHADTLGSMANVASWYRRQQRYDEARELLGEAVDVERQVWGTGDRRTQRSMSLLADTYFDQDRYDEAVRLYEELVDVQRKVLGPGDETTLASMNDLAFTFLTLKDPQAALRVALEAVENSAHPDPDLLDTLSQAYYGTGQREAAIENQKKAIVLVPEKDTDKREELEQTLARFEAGER